MFTGLIDRIGIVSVISNNSGMMTLEINIPNHDAYQCLKGDSIAVNGCCLTLTELKVGTAKFDVSSETMAKTNLCKLQTGDRVNLERALEVGSRLGGHMVSGHVDAKAELIKVKPGEDGWLFQVKVEKSWSKYLIHKGSITLDGVSLTINALSDGKDDSIADLMLIPTTLSETTFGNLPEGWLLNMEVDLVGKYIERLTKR